MPILRHQVCGLLFLNFNRVRCSTLGFSFKCHYHIIRTTRSRVVADLKVNFSLISGYFDNSSIRTLGRRRLLQRKSTNLQFTGNRIVPSERDTLSWRSFGKYGGISRSFATANRDTSKSAVRLSFARALFLAAGISDSIHFKFEREFPFTRQHRPIFDLWLQPQGHGEPAHRVSG